MIPPERLRALVTLLYPDEMTPTAKHQFDQLLSDADDSPAAREPSAQLAQLYFTHAELNALIASLANPIAVVERATGQDGAVWTLLNSLRTALTEAIWGLERSAGLRG